MPKNFDQAIISAGLLTQDKLDRLDIPDNDSSLVYKICKSGLIEESAFIDFYKKFTGCSVVSLKEVKPAENIYDLIDGDILRKYYSFPITKDDSVITMAMADPIDYQAIQLFERITQCRINPVLAGFVEISSILDEQFGVLTSVKNIVQNLENVDMGNIAFGFMENEVFQMSSKAGPINRLLHLVITHALKEEASDIHFEPTDKEMQCRFRIDGVLSKFLTFPKALSNSITSSIKVLAKMDIAEKRLPLDGGFQVKIDNRVIDLRVSSFPTIDGEKIVVRILDKSGMRFSLDGLGFLEKMLQQFIPVINKNNGIVLVTGPTGSGKTTTLYAVLDRIKSIEKNIVTIEDPIEYHLDMINQSQVNVKAGLTFARGLRSFLRQDPDILLVGEIRDQETAEISFQAALTGHLVFSTLHTNDAASSITRLKDMGIENYLLSSAIIGLLAQRLARRVCRNCLEEYVPDKDALAWLGVISDPHRKYYRGKGCDQCKQTGFKGRVGLYEFLVMDEDISNLIHEPNVTAEKIKQLAIKKGMISLRDDAREKVLTHMTTAEEVYRVLR